MKTVRLFLFLALSLVVLLLAQGSFALPPTQTGAPSGLDEDQLAAMAHWGSVTDPNVAGLLAETMDTAVTSTLATVHVGYDKATGQYLDDPSLVRSGSPRAVTPKAETDIDPAVIAFGRSHQLQVTPGMAPALQQRLASAAAPDEYLVLQFTYPVDIQLKDALAAQGVVFADPLDKLSFYAKVPAAAVTAVSQAIDQGKINFVGQVPPAFHLSDGLQARLDSLSAEDAGLAVTVQLFETPTPAQLAALEKLMTIERQSDGAMHLIEGMVAAHNVMALAENTAVQLIQEQIPNESGSPEVPPVPATPTVPHVNLEGNLATGGDIVKQTGYGGTDVNVMVIDSGIAHQGSTYHPDLPLSRITDQYAWYPNVSTDAAASDSHGTHVAASIGGSGVASGDLAWQGIAPDVNFLIYRLCCNSSGYGYYDSDFQAALQRGAARAGHVANNSWGGGNNTYAVSSQLADRAARGTYSNQWMNLVIITHNDNALSRSPGTAKNAITVGAVKDGNWPQATVATCGGVSDDDWPPGERICFSNYGPINLDGDQHSRVKPDLMAPGVRITSAVPWYFYGDNRYYDTMDGTSMAAPQVSGSVAQFLDAYPQFLSWPELVKAALIASATDVGGTDTAHYGRGMVNAYHAIYDQTNVSETSYWIDSLSNTGDMVTYTLNIPAGFSEVRVALAWMDPVAGDGTDDVINDLDVRVYDGSGALIGSSLTPDDTVEYVKVTSGVPGTWHIEVEGYSISTSPQPFGLASVTVLHPAELSLTASISPPAGTFSGGTFYLYTTISNAGFAAPGSYVRLHIPSTADFTVEGARIYTDDGRSHYYDDTELMNDTAGTYWRVAVGETIANHARLVRWYIRYNRALNVCPQSGDNDLEVASYFRDKGATQTGGSDTAALLTTACNVYLPTALK